MKNLRRDITISTFILPHAALFKISGKDFDVPFLASYDIEAGFCGNRLKVVARWAGNHLVPLIYKNITSSIYKPTETKGNTKRAY